MADEASAPAEGGAGAPEAKRRRTRRSGWDTPAPGAAAVSAFGNPAGFGAPMAQSSAAVSNLVQQQLALAMAPRPPGTAVSYQQMMAAPRPPGAAAYSAGGSAATSAAVAAALAIAGSHSVNNEANERRKRTRIHVGSLHYALQEADIRAVFSPFGTIKKVSMTIDQATGRHKGFCFLEFETPESAETALTSMNGFELAGRQITVGRPHDSSQAPAQPAAIGNVAATASAMLAAGGMLPIGAGGAAAAVGAGPRFVPVGNTKVYIGNVAPVVTAEMLRAVFQPFGLVIGCEMVSDPANPGQHRGFGFVQFLEEKLAKVALETMNGFDLAGRSLRVAWATDQHKPLPLLPGVVLPNQPPAQPVSAADAVAAALRGAPNVPMPTVSSIAPPAPAAAPVPPPPAPATTSPPPPAAAASPPSLPFGKSPASPLPLPPPTNGAPAATAAQIAPAATPAAAAAGAAAPERSPCVVLDNMVGPEDLEDPSLKDEIGEECAKYGPVERVEAVLRPPPSIGEARVFVLFATDADAAAAVSRLHERYFGGRVVQARLYDAAAFLRGDLDL